MNKKLSLLFIIMTCLIIGLFWFSVYLGQDEFAELQTEQEEEIEGEERAVDEDGLTIIHITKAEQQNSGITTSLTTASSMQTQISAYGSVFSTSALIEAKSHYIALQSELSLAKTGVEQHLQQYNRLKTLNADDKNVSDQVVNEAYAQVKADQAQIQASRRKLSTFKNKIKLKWGDRLSSLLGNGHYKPYLAGLLTHKYVLVQISLPIDSSPPKVGDTLRISPLGSQALTIEARYVAVAHQSDANGTGKTYYFSAPSEQLREGMRVQVLSGSHHGESLEGSIIPNDAVIWYAGQPWVYVRRDAQEFLRKPISADTEVGDGWFDPAFAIGTEIVTTGAQLLLSEEFKYLIKNENDD